MNPGVRSEGADYFDDVLEAEESAGAGGILDSAGLRDYDRVRSAVRRDGLEVRMNCRHCNSTRDVTIVWQELMQVAGNSQGAPPVLPQNWRYSPNNQTAYEPIACPKCGKPEGFAVHLTPEEARKHVNQGVTAGYVNPHHAAQVHQQVAAMQAQRSRGG